MKKILVICLSVAVIAGCIPKVEENTDPFDIYTEVAKTVVIQLTQQAELIPTSTVTATLEPTTTLTNTPEPTPTMPTLTPTWAYNPPGAIKVPILAYNHIADDATDNLYYEAGDEINISSQTFQQQMTILKDAGYSAMPVSLIVKAIKTGAEIPSQPVAITFDVMSIGIYQKAFPIMKELEYVATLFVTLNHLDTDGMITTVQLEEMMDAGWEIGSRGMNGYDLTNDYSLLSNEISGSRLALEEKFGIPITLFAYPYGRSDDMIFERVISWGYKAAVGYTWYETPEHTDLNLYYLSRYVINNGLSVEQFVSFLPWKPVQIPTTVPTSGL
ncbi:MAG: polysaccharide deacetylase family protein [Anaerolineaceae bacterium]|nr:polysaccharide deacetylase family protein [Anaerolineaceae bacterium]